MREVVRYIRDTRVNDSHNEIIQKKKIDETTFSTQRRKQTRKTQLHTTMHPRLLQGFTTQDAADMSPITS